MSKRRASRRETEADIRQWLNITFEPDAFATPEQAWATAATTRDELPGSITHLDGVDLEGELPTFVVAAVARGLGLHDAIWREGHVSNRHAVWPLLRSLLDTVLVTLEVRRNPAYAAVVLRHPTEWGTEHRRFGSQKLISRSAIEGPNIPAMWDYLTAADHFGWVGFVQAIGSWEQVSPETMTLHMTTDARWMEADEEVMAANHLARLTRGLAQTVRKIVADHPDTFRAHAGDPAGNA